MFVREFQYRNLFIWSYIFRGGMNKAVNFDNTIIISDCEIINAQINW